MKRRGCVCLRPGCSPSCGHALLVQRRSPCRSPASPGPGTRRHRGEPGLARPSISVGPGTVLAASGPRSASSHQSSRLGLESHFRLHVLERPSSVFNKILPLRPNWILTSSKKPPPTRPTEGVLSCKHPQHTQPVFPSQKNSITAAVHFRPLASCLVHRIGGGMTDDGLSGSPSRPRPLRPLDPCTGLAHTSWGTCLAPWACEPGALMHTGHSLVVITGHLQSGAVHVCTW